MANELLEVWVAFRLVHEKGSKTCIIQLLAGRCARRDRGWGQGGRAGTAPGLCWVAAGKNRCKPGDGLSPSAEFNRRWFPESFKTPSLREGFVVFFFFFSFPPAAGNSKALALKPPNLSPAPRGTILARSQEEPLEPLPLGGRPGCGGLQRQPLGGRLGPHGVHGLDPSSCLPRTPVV